MDLREAPFQGCLYVLASGLLPLFREHPEPPAVTADRVGHHPRCFDARIQSPPEHSVGEFSAWFAFRSAMILQLVRAGLGL
jgi:hypothetical protein